ncbi:MAG TPA: hypothetical protein VJ952_11650 [Opitutales bacterium]|nr:hypothetical protein [Opitutales bacterium]
MVKEIPIEELEAGIHQFYERYSQKKVALAAFMVGVFTIGLSFVSYALTTTGWLAIIVFGIVGVVSVNLVVIFVVPPSGKLAAGRELICAAVRDPSRIKAVDEKGIKLADNDGELHKLAGPEREVWASRVVPYFMQIQSALQPAAKARAERKYTVSERKYIEDRRKEVVEIEKRIEEKQRELEKEREKMKKRRAELEELEKGMREKAKEVGSGSGPGPDPTL